MRLLSAVLLAAAGTMGLVHAQTDCPGSIPNTLPIYDAAPTFVANSTWGSRWETGSPALPVKLPVLHVVRWGSMRGPCDCVNMRS